MGEQWYRSALCWPHFWTIWSVQALHTPNTPGKLDFGMPLPGPDTSHHGEHCSSSDMSQPASSMEFCQRWVSAPEKPPWWGSQDRNNGKLAFCSMQEGLQV